jgi:hypothetical protein
MSSALSQSEEATLGEGGILFAILAFVGASAGIGVLIGWLAERRQGGRRARRR